MIDSPFDSIFRASCPDSDSDVKTLLLNCLNVQKATEVSMRLMGIFSQCTGETYRNSFAFTQADNYLRYVIRVSSPTSVKEYAVQELMEGTLLSVTENPQSN